MNVLAVVLMLAPLMDDGELSKLQNKVAPSVVRIAVERTSDPAAIGIGGGNRALLDYYRRPAGSVTGTVVAADGWIVTTLFNMQGTLKKIAVTTADGKTHDGTLVGFDRNLDIALIKIEAAGLAALPEGKTTSLAQGDFAAVVGVSSDSSGTTINTGIISAVGRMKGTAFQTDAEMNYGNAGGPVVDGDGRLLGIACHIDNRAFWGQSSGVGFASKIERIDEVLPRLKKGEKIEKPKQAYLGVLVAEAPDMEGVVLMQVTPGSPAASAGLQANDVILSVDDKVIAEEEDLKALIGGKKAGDEVKITYRREKETKSVTVKLGETP